MRKLRSRDCESYAKSRSVWILGVFDEIGIREVEVAGLVKATLKAEAFGSHEYLRLQKLYWTCLDQRSCTNTRNKLCSARLCLQQQQEARTPLCSLVLPPSRIVSRSKFWEG